MRSIQLITGALAVVATSSLIGWSGAAQAQEPTITTRERHRPRVLRHLGGRARLRVALREQHRRQRHADRHRRRRRRRRRPRDHPGVQGRPRRARRHEAERQAGRHRGHRQGRSARRSPSTRSTTTPVSTSPSTAPTVGWPDDLAAAPGRARPSRSTARDCVRLRPAGHQGVHGRDARLSDPDARRGWGRPGRTASGCR